MDNYLSKTYIPHNFITSRHLIYQYFDSASLVNQPSQTTTPKPTRTALLLHGHGDLSLAWRDVIPVFAAAGIRCIVPDLLGFGNTSKPLEAEAYKAKLMCQDMVEILSNAGIEKSQKLIILSHDWGTHLASRLILHHPSLFSSCILLSAPYMPPSPQQLTLADWTALFPNFSYWNFFTSPGCPALLRETSPLFFNLTVRKGDEVAVPMDELEGILTAALGKDKDTSNSNINPNKDVDKPNTNTSHDQIPLPTLWSPSTSTAYINAYLLGGWEGPMNWYKAFFLNFHDEEIFLSTSTLPPTPTPQLTHPFLLLVGENDPAVPVEVARASEKYLGHPRSSVRVLKGAGHWIPQERGGEVARLVVGWLEGLEG